MNFKKWTGLVMLLSVLSFSACNKTTDIFDYEDQYELEKPLIEQHALQNLSEPHFDENSGIWYQIIDPGESGSYEYRIEQSGEAKRLVYPKITINYEGRLLDGTIFDQNHHPDGIEFPLNGLIQAWHVAFFPVKINEDQVNGLTENGLQIGSKIRFITPSMWGYGNQQQGNVPANSPLDFTITVLDIKE
ncbi:MAG TPA: FKBP-type peptidyl-prolyl cis-trans isomerase [Sphingobacteriaceae bacterium]|nr:FKBP-type peptidyl-prolyl cis-trans isomerase [Sphingobacteriaceae bacterium]